MQPEVNELSDNYPKVQQKATQSSNSYLIISLKNYSFIQKVSDSTHKSKSITQNLLNGTPTSN